MHHRTDRIAHTTTFVTPVVEHWLEREIAQWVHPLYIIQFMYPSVIPSVQTSFIPTSSCTVHLTFILLSICHELIKGGFVLFINKEKTT